MSLITTMLDTACRGVNALMTVISRAITNADNPTDNRTSREPAVTPEQQAEYERVCAMARRQMAAPGSWQQHQEENDVLEDSVVVITCTGNGAQTNNDNEINTRLDRRWLQLICNEGNGRNPNLWYAVANEDSTQASPVLNGNPVTQAQQNENVAYARALRTALGEEDFSGSDALLQGNVGSGASIETKATAGSSSDSSNARSSSGSQTSGSDDEESCGSPFFSSTTSTCSCDDQE